MDKILFFDIDGTLGQHGVITESNLKALHLLKEKGYEIVPVSELIIRDNYSINNEGRQIANNTSCNDE